MSVAALPFQCGDTWPVGSFRVREAEAMVDLIRQGFDVPCWPELTGWGESEELLGFWLALFIAWDQDGKSAAIIDERLLARPGVHATLGSLRGRTVPLLKGQMIGPVTLLWALQKRQYPVIDRYRIFLFLRECFVRQAAILAQVASQTIISLDEPCAFFDPMAEKIWQEFLNWPDYESSAAVALHCCGTPRASWLYLPWQVVHFDVNELETVMAAPDQGPHSWQEAWQHYFNRGGWLAAGVLGGHPLVAMLEQEGPDNLDALENLQQWFPEAAGEQVLLSTTCGWGEDNLLAVQTKMARLQRLSDAYVEMRRARIRERHA